MWFLASDFLKGYVYLVLHLLRFMFGKETTENLKLLLIFQYKATLVHSGQ